MIYFRKILRELFPQKFKAFRHSTDYWENRYYFCGNSGAGSYGVQAEEKADYLNGLLSVLDYDTVVEFGSGDGHNATLYHAAHYYGFDISASAVHLAKKKCARPSYHFALIDAGLEEAVNEIKCRHASYLTISFDVILHLVEEDVYQAYLDTLDRNSLSHLLVFSQDFDRETTTKHVRYRLYSKDLIARGWTEDKKYFKDGTDGKAFKLFHRER